MGRWLLLLAGLFAVAELVRGALLFDGLSLVVVVLAVAGITLELLHGVRS